MTDMRDERERETHPSYAQISFSNTQSTGTTFYGSELPQRSYVSMEISRSEKQQSLTDEYYYGTEKILRLRMSKGQFSDLITSMNRGDGIPCTLEWLCGERIEDKEHTESRKEMVHRSFKERMSKFATGIKSNQEELEQILDKKSIGKADRENIGKMINGMVVEITQNIPFFSECFQETMDDMVSEAKREVDNAIQSKIEKLGLEALHQQNKLIEGGPSTLDARIGQEDEG